MRIYTVNHKEKLGKNTYELQTIFSSVEKAKTYAKWLSENNQIPTISEYVLEKEVFKFEGYIQTYD